MSDVKDILGLPRGGEGAGGPSGAAPAPKKAAKPVAPKGMSREAFALLDQSHPIMPSVLSMMSKKQEDEGKLPRVRSKSFIPRWAAALFPP